MKKLISLCISALLLISVFPMTVGAASETYDSLAFSQGVGIFYVDGANFTPSTDTDYRFFAAAYNANSELIGVKSQVVSMNGGSADDLFGKINFNGEAYKNQIASVKTMLWDEDLRPVVAAKDHIYGYESVTGNSKSYRTQKTWSTVEEKSGNTLFDGDKTTSAGTGEAGKDAYIFGDLGVGGQQIDKVSITAYDKHLRLVGVKYYLTNTQPIGNANYDKSDWVLLGEITTCPKTVDDPGATMTFDLTAAQAGVYRYIVADYTAGTTQGGVIFEMEAYKKTEDQVIERLESVTGIASYRTKKTWNTSVEVSGNTLFDGSKTTAAGSGTAGDDAYVYGDLGVGGQRIDKVVITAYDQHLRLAGVKYYLTNTQPIGNANHDKSDWVLLGEITTCPKTVDAAGATMTFDLTAEQADVYRYIVADYTAGTTQGGYIYEMEVYKKSYQYESVTEGASSYFTLLNGGSSSIDGNKFFDGDNTVGFGGETNKYCYLYGDLGTGGKQIDKVVITAYDKHQRTRGMKFYLANSLNSEDGWVYLGEHTGAPTSLTSAEAVSSYELSDAQAGNYRYIVAKYKTGDATAVGGLVYEMEAFKKAIR